MAIRRPGLSEQDAERWAPLLLALGVAFMLWAACQRLFTDLNPDEAIFIGLARLVSGQVRLYRELRFQHSPLIVALAQPFAWLGWVHEIWPFRFLALAAQALAAFSLLLSPAFAGRRAWGWIAGAAYAGLYGAWGTRELGFSFSDYTFAGAAWVAALAFVGLPAAAGIGSGPRAALLGGMALALGVLGCPSTGLAGLLFAAAVLVALDGEGRQAFGVGMAAVAAALLLWMALYGDLRGAWDLVVVFNLKVYPSLARETDMGGLFSEAWKNLWATLRWPNVYTALFLAWPAYLAWEALGAPPRRRAALLLLALAFTALHVRLYYWKALPYSSSAYAGLAAGGALFLAAQPGRRRDVAEALLGLGLLGLLAYAYQLPTGSERFLFWENPPAQRAREDARLVSQGLPPGSSLLAIPHDAEHYMLTDLRIAAWTLTYNPADALMDFPPGRPPRPCNLCEGLKADPPSVIYHRPGAYIFGKDVDAQLPPCYTAYEREACTQVPGLWGWWMRRELLPANLAARGLNAPRSRPKKKMKKGSA